MKNFKFEKLFVSCENSGNGIGCYLRGHLYKQGVSLSYASNLSLKEIADVQKMCESKPHALLFTKHEKLGNLAKLIVNNIEDEELSFVDNLERENDKSSNVWTAGVVDGSVITLTDGTSLTVSDSSNV